MVWSGQRWSNNFFCGWKEESFDCWGNNLKLFHLALREKTPRKNTELRPSSRFWPNFAGANFISATLWDLFFIIDDWELIQDICSGTLSTPWQQRLNIFLQERRSSWKAPSQSCAKERRDRLSFRKVIEAERNGLHRQLLAPGIRSTLSALLIPRTTPHSSKITEASVGVASFSSPKTPGRLSIDAIFIRR